MAEVGRLSCEGLHSAPWTGRAVGSEEPTVSSGEGRSPLPGELQAAYSRQSLLAACLTLLCLVQYWHTFTDWWLSNQLATDRLPAHASWSPSFLQGAPLPTAHLTCVSRCRAQFSILPIVLSEEEIWGTATRPTLQAGLPPALRQEWLEPDRCRESPFTSVAWHQDES